MRATMQQIAELAGVSRGTVDRALHHRGRIAPEIEKRITEIANSLGYSAGITKKGEPRKAASRKQKEAKSPVVQKAKTFRIGVITYLCNAGFMQEVKRGIESAAKELKDWNVEVLLKESSTIDEQMQLQYIDEVLEDHVDALAIMPIDTGLIRKKLYDVAQKSSIPVVMFNSDLPGVPRLCYVGMDNYQSGRAAAGLMNMLTGGSGKILCITGTFSNQLNNARIDGFINEVKDSFPDLSIAAVRSSFDNEEEVCRIVEDAMLTISGINGIFVVSSGQSGLRSAFRFLKLDRRPKVIIYDQTPKNEKLLQEDLVDFLIDQNGYEQGYRPLHLLFDYLNTGMQSFEKGGSENTEISIKTRYTL